MKECGISGGLRSVCGGSVTTNIFIKLVNVFNGFENCGKRFPGKGAPDYVRSLHIAVRFAKENHRKPLIVNIVWRCPTSGVLKRAAL